MTEKHVKQWRAADIDWRYDVTMASEGAAEQNRYFVNPPANCDLCVRALAQDEYFVDGRVKGRGCGFMCVDCFGEHGVGLGLGIGQLYRRERDRRWLLVPGEEYYSGTDHGRGKDITHIPAYVRSCRGLHLSMSRCHRTRSLCHRAGSRGRRQ
jgi:hypothetical protein